MSLRLYVDVHVPFAVTAELRLRGVDVLTSAEDEAAVLKNPLLLDRAFALGRVLVTQDTDFLRETSRRHAQAIAFAGIIYIPQMEVTIGRCVQDLELCAKATDPEEWINWVQYLPL